MNNPAHSRKVFQVITPQATTDGAGVKLSRSIGTMTLDYLDPFLLLDEFKSVNPDDYIRGFPDHPHRGIETVTYMLHGVVDHRDSIGNAGTVAKGDAQWMTAGSGIIHAEMPKRVEGYLWGYQLWVNLPAKDKMCKPRYQDIPAAKIPTITREDGTVIRIVTGQIDGVKGPVTDIAADPTYLDVTLKPGTSFSFPTPESYTSFAFVVRGSGDFGPEEKSQSVDGSRLVIFEKGDLVEARAIEKELQFLFLLGKPFGEPIARYGPFVMNTKEEIEQTIRDLRDGSFLKR